MKVTRQFNLRFLFLALFLAALPCAWFAQKNAEYRQEQATIDAIRKIAPATRIDTVYIGPYWLARLGFVPAWLTRVDAVDVTGLMLVSPAVVTLKDIPVHFSDSDFAEMHPHLLRLPHLRSLYLPYTKTTDTSLELLRQYPRMTFLNLQQTAMTSQAVRQLEKDRPEIEIAFWHEFDQIQN